METVSSTSLQQTRVYFTLRRYDSYRNIRLTCVWISKPRLPVAIKTVIPRHSMKDFPNENQTAAYQRFPRGNCYNYNWEAFSDFQRGIMNRVFLMKPMGRDRVINLLDNSLRLIVGLWSYSVIVINPVERSNQHPRKASQPDPILVSDYAIIDDIDSVCQKTLRTRSRDSDISRKGEQVNVD